MKICTCLRSHKVKKFQNKPFVKILGLSYDRKIRYEKIFLILQDKQIFVYEVSLTTVVSMIQLNMRCV